MLWAQRSTEPRLPVVKLEGFRVFLRPPRAEDWPTWESLRRANRAFLKPYEPAWHESSLTRENFMLRLERQGHEWKADRAHAFFIFTKDGTLVGGMNVNNITRGAAQFASLGYWLGEAYQGQGYMAEALRLVLAHCFENLALHRMNAACLTHNTRSRNLLLRAGFREEGFAEKYIQIDGVWADHLLFGLPVEAWRMKTNRKPG